MRRLIIVAAACVVPSMAAAQPHKLLETKKWTGSVTRKTELKHPPGSCNVELDAVETYTNLELAVTDLGDDFKCWSAKRPAHLAMHLKSELRIEGGGYTLEEQTANGDATGEVRLCAYAADNKYRITTGLESVKGRYHKKAVLPGITTVNETETREIGKPNAGTQMEAPLPQSRTLTGKRTFKAQWGSVCGMFDVTVTEDWGLSGDPVVPKAFLDPPPRPWLPEDGNQTTVKVRWTEAPATAIELVLAPGHETGRYMNDASASTDADLRPIAGAWSITPNGPRAQKYTAKLEDIDSNAREAELPIASFDYGAYGRVSGRVKINGRWIQALTPTGAGFVRVPFDEDDDKIADQWEDSVGMLDKGATWDEDPRPSGAKTKGDSISLYQEYRGFLVDNPKTGRGRGWTRLDPRVMEHFVDDPDKIVKPKLFTDATGVEVVLTDIFHSNRRVVNFRKGHGHARDKYLVTIRAVAGEHEHGYKNDKPDPGDDYRGTAGATYVIGTPRQVQWCAVFRDHIKRSIKRNGGTIGEALDGHNAAVAALLLDSGRFTRAQLQLARGLVDEAAFLAKVVQQQIDLTVVHELGHTIGIKHHAPKDTGGEKSCPIRYDDDVETLTVLMRAVGHEDDPLPVGVGKMCTVSQGEISLLD